jgi:hypothetical protein
MKSKIEKLGYFLIPCSTDESIADVLQRISEKVDELVDHLNSQSQPEECEHKYILETHPFGLSRIRCPKCGDTRDIEDFLKGEDTPEEWEDNIRDLVYDIRADRLVQSEVIIDKVKQLLEERVEDILEQIQDWISSDKGGDIDDEYLNILIDDIEELKLNTKKK